MSVVRLCDAESQVQCRIHDDVQRVVGQIRRIGRQSFMMLIRLLNERLLQQKRNDFVEFARGKKTVQRRACLSSIDDNQDTALFGVQLIYAIGNFRLSLGGFCKYLALQGSRRGSHWSHTLPLMLLSFAETAIAIAPFELDALQSKRAWRSHSAHRRDVAHDRRHAAMSAILWTQPIMNSR